MKQTKILETIKQVCPDSVYLVGFARLEGLLPARWSQFPYGISLARKLDDAIINELSAGPTLEYFQLYHRINDELNQKTVKIATLLQEEGIDALAVPATVSDHELDEEYHRTLRYPLSHKMVATRAGLGWIGKTDLLVTPTFGPRVRLASILVSEAFTIPGKPFDESLCGDCSVCVKSCPAQAANGTVWTIHTDRNEFFDPFRCRDYCRKISFQRLGKEISLCGLCLYLCPKGRSTGKRS
ncbi:MAG: epoxyqueuosine reductase [Spirochaetes bacterium]|nr:epoxyqueuosine reductase [Spirochaetota bacterium]